MIKDFVALAGRVHTLEGAFARSIKVGPVEEVHPTKGYRLKLGEADGEVFLSPWYPHPEDGKQSIPLKKGQIVGVLNPAGDPRQGFILRGGYSDDLPTPNTDMQANVFDDAGVRITIKDGFFDVVAANGGHLR